MERRRASVKESYHTTYVLKEKNLTKICDKLRDISDEVFVSLECEDSIERGYDGAEDVINNFENPKSKRLKEMLITGRNEGLRTSRIRVHEWITIDLEGEEKELEKVLQEIEDEIENMKPWYKHISSTDLVKVGLMMPAVIFFGALLIASIYGIEESGSSQSKETLLGTLILLGPTLLFILLDYIKKWTFPKKTFAIGKGVDRFETMENVRWAIVTSLVIPIILTFIFKIANF